MKKFICLNCGSHEYSSHDNGEPCQRCMGKMVEEPMNRRDLELVKADKEETE